MARRLVGGSFSPKKPTEKPAIDDPPSLILRNNAASAAKGSGGVDSLDLTTAEGFYVNEEDDDEEMSDNVDLSVVRSVLGAGFKLDSTSNSPKEEKAKGVSFSGVDSSNSSVADDVKTRSDLLAKIERLEVKLKQAELDLSAEKARRKKSSRSTLKLAKEINKRTIEAGAQQKALEKMTMANATLETKLNATRKELEERITASEMATRDYHSHLSEAQAKHRNDTHDYDRRMSEMMQAHNQEVQALRSQLAAANRDLDMLRGKLVSLEVREAERIAEHTVYTGIDPTEARKIYSKKQKRITAVGIVLAVVAWFYQCTGFSMDAICGPAMPGTKLYKESMYEAPWWAPGALKPKGFAVCGDRKRVALSWSGVANEVGRVVAVTLDEAYPSTLLDRKAILAIVKYDRLDIMERKGKVESVKLPWV